MHTKVARVSSSHPYFKNWNDLHILLMVAEYRSFARAAEVLGVNQVTVAKRLADLEMALGCRLFTRRRIGAAPTQVCREILADAFPVMKAMRRVEEKLGQARSLQPAVTICAPPGVLTYTLRPALQSGGDSLQPIDVKALRRTSLPELKFTSDLQDADISVLVSAEKDLPKIKGA